MAAHSDRCALCGRKEPDKDVEWLDTAFATHASGLSQMAVTPFFLPYLNDSALCCAVSELNVQVPVVSAKP